MREPATDLGGDDLELVAGLRGGDAKAFDIAYDRYRPRLYGFLLRMSHSPQTAEDLLQETWMRLARSARRLEAETNLRAWLFTVARNLFLSHRRWAAVDADRRGQLADVGDQIHPQTPLEAAAASETARRLESALAKLPSRYLEVVLLVGVESMTPTAVAAIINESPAATRKRLSRARAMLREELDQ